MKAEDKKLLSEIDALVAKHKKTIEENEQKEEQKKKEELTVVTKDDLKELLEQMNKKAEPIMPTETKQIVQQPQQGASQQQKQPMGKRNIAYQLWKDSKATSIVCLIAIVLPMITILVTMFSDGAMYALMIAFAGLIYPCFVFVKMVGYQTRLNKKYGFKPLFQFQQQRQNDEMML